MRTVLTLLLPVLSVVAGIAASHATPVAPLGATTAPDHFIVEAQYIKGPRHPGDTAEFRYPRLQGTFVDACETWGQGCGAAGANQYCQMRHFSHALKWTIFVSNHTFVLGTNQFCSGKCRAFSYGQCG